MLHFAPIISKVYEDYAILVHEGLPPVCIADLFSRINSLLFPEYSLLFPENSLLFPENSLLFPEDRLLFPEDRLLFPEDRLPITPRPFRGGVRGGVNQKMSHPIFKYSCLMHFLPYTSYTSHTCLRCKKCKKCKMF